MQKEVLTMIKRELVVRIANELKINQQLVYKVIQKTLDYITEALARGETIEFRDFGVFQVYTRKPRIGRNPRKPKIAVPIPPRKVVKFKAGKIMKEKIASTP